MIAFFLSMFSCNVLIVDLIALLPRFFGYGASGVISQFSWNCYSSVAPYLSYLGSLYVGLQAEKAQLQYLEVNSCGGGCSNFAILCP